MGLHYGYAAGVLVGAMSEWTEWLQERGTDTYCPLEGGSVVIGMNYVGDAPGKVVGEFWFDDAGNVHIKLEEHKQ